jgi:thioredoxin-related protein
MFRAARIPTVIGVTVFLLGTLSWGLAGTHPVKWFTYAEGMAHQERTGKKALITFTAEWCGYCTKLDRETFGDRRVAAFLNESFVPIRVDFDRENQVATDYNVRQVPVTWFVDEKGERISNLPGFIPPDRFLDILRYVHSDSYEDVPFSEYLKSM